MSSISSISSGVNPYQTSTANGLGASLKALGTALSSGNLSDAQTAFSILQQQLQNLPKSSASQTTAGTTGSSSSSNPIQTDLNAVQSALQSGDVSGAQTAFAKLSTDLQSTKGHHGHHHHGGGGKSALSAGTSDSTTNTTSTGSTTSATGSSSTDNLFSALLSTSPATNSTSVNQLG